MRGTFIFSSLCHVDSVMIHLVCLRQIKIKYLILVEVVMIQIKTKCPFSNELSASIAMKFQNHPIRLLSYTIFSPLKLSVLSLLKLNSPLARYVSLSFYFTFPGQQDISQEGQRSHVWYGCHNT